MVPWKRSEKISKCNIRISNEDATPHPTFQDSKDSAVQSYRNFRVKPLSVLYI